MDGWLGKSRQFAAHSGAELCLVIFLLLTIGVVSWQHELFGRELVLDRHSATHYSLNAYADSGEGGASTVSVARRPLAWSCDLRPETTIRYCAYQIIFGRFGAKRGLDLRNLDTIVLKLDYHGPSTTMRALLKNGDPLYSNMKDERSDKVNSAEFSVVDGSQTVVILRDELSVAGWWAGRQNDHAGAGAD